MALITCEELGFGYEGKTVTAPISFQLSSGDYLYIIGENGAGKSTLMKTLLHLQTPISGKLSMGDGLKKNEIGYLPQQTLVQRDFPASVWEIVLSGFQGSCGLRPFYSRAEKEEAERNMEKIGVSELRDRCYRELSGGQQQRVLLARALCATKKLLLLDEPVAGLDPRVTADMYRLIQELNQRDGISIIMISHDIEAAYRYASHILYIGQTSFFGSRDAFVESETGKFYYRYRRGLEHDAAF
ncbi:MAG: metal ABC transporter ATP-binding protein [Oribacterium sp.]